MAEGGLFIFLIDRSGSMSGNKMMSEEEEYNRRREEEIRRQI